MFHFSSCAHLILTLISTIEALREADVIVSTSIGAADPQLLAACGIYAEEQDSSKRKDSDGQPDSQFGVVREWAPDNLPPLSLPFVIIDEACQSVEPATLIPIVSSNSCRALVMLGDPCQVRQISSSSGLRARNISWSRSGMKLQQLTYCSTYCFFTAAANCSQRYIGQR